VGLHRPDRRHPSRFASFAKSVGAGALADALTLDPPAFGSGPVELTRFPIGNHYDIPSLNPVPQWITDELASMLPQWLVDRVVPLCADYRSYQASVTLRDRETSLLVTKGPIDQPENLTRRVPVPRLA